MLTRPPPFGPWFGHPCSGPRSPPGGSLSYDQNHPRGLRVPIPSLEKECRGNPLIYRIGRHTWIHMNKQDWHLSGIGILDWLALSAAVNLLEMAKLDTKGSGSEYTCIYASQDWVAYGDSRSSMKGVPYLEHATGACH